MILLLQTGSAPPTSEQDYAQLFGQALGVTPASSVRAGQTGALGAALGVVGSTALVVAIGPAGAFGQTLGILSAATLRAGQTGAFAYALGATPGTPIILVPFLGKTFLVAADTVGGTTTGLRIFVVAADTVAGAV